MLAHRDDLVRPLDVTVGKLGDMYQAFDPLVDLDEGAESDDLGDTTLDHVAHAMRGDDLLPWVFLRLLETQGDALPVAVDVEHLDVDLLVDLQHLGRMVDVRPRQLADVDEAVDAVEVDEGAEVDDVGDGALDDVANRELVDDLLAHLLALLLQHRAPREHHVVAVAVHLDDAAVELLAHVLLQVLHTADVDQRSRQEPAHAEVEDEAALDDLDDVALYGLAALEGLLDALPGLLELGPLLGEDQAPVGVFLLHDQSVDLLAQRDLVGRADRFADGKLADGDDAFRLVADVDEHLVLVDTHHQAGDDVALGEDVDGGVVVGHDLAVDDLEIAVTALDELDGLLDLGVLLLVCHVGRLPPGLRTAVRRLHRRMRPE